ncbi:MAG: ribosomal-protein-alanine N-acetyltransferase, partial [SAR202 cluster bacterium]|nr:ribosomal-protein-alanine N-acetyltransferase [SAR202 cluster bacterium]
GNVNGSSKALDFAIRPMERGDIAQVSALERNAFPEMQPPTLFEKELANSLAGYLVAWRPSRPVDDRPRTPLLSRRTTLWDRLFAPRGWRRQGEALGQAMAQEVAGYVGVWFMTDEAHIVAVGVLDRLRGQGIGELLLIGAVELALLRGSRVATLEVRVSNQVAQSLYTRYGFKHAGRRRRYYSDNGEDALVMTTDPIHSDEYLSMFRSLVQRHEQHWGKSVRILSAGKRAPPGA